MTCEACQSQLLEYVNEELGPAQRREAEAHLATCEACGRELAEIREALQLAREALPVEVPSEEGVASLLAYAEQQAARMKEARSPATGGGGLLPKWLSQLVLRPGFALVLLVVAVAGLSLKLAGDVVSTSSNALAGSDAPSPAARSIQAKRDIKDFAGSASGDAAESGRQAPTAAQKPAAAPRPMAAAEAPKPTRPSAEEAKPRDLAPETVAAVATPEPAPDDANRGAIDTAKAAKLDAAKDAPAEPASMLEEQLGARLADPERRKNEALDDRLVAGDRGGADGLVGGLGSTGYGSSGVGVGGTSAAPGSFGGSVGTKGAGRGGGGAAVSDLDAADRRGASDGGLAKSKEKAPAKAAERPLDELVLEESRRFSKSRGDTTTALPKAEAAGAPSSSAPPPPPAPAAPAASAPALGPSGAVAGAELEEDSSVGLGGGGTRDAKRRPVAAGKSAGGEKGRDELRARREAHSGVVANAITEIEQAEVLYREAQRLSAAERRAEALAVYLRVVEAYPGSDRARQSLYAAWLIEHERGAAVAASSLLARLEQRYPGSPELSLAKARLARERGGRVEAEKKESKRPAARAKTDFADGDLDKSQAPVEAAPAEIERPAAEPAKAY